jgi:4-diphosphocytidyl-2-C-methyl-D-erythritol kinase
MHLSHYLDDVVVWAPAKVNLFLEVLGKRPDGYHDIATLMVALRLYDTLVFRADSSLTLRCSDTRLSAGTDNLVTKAARLLQDSTGCKQGASIRLVKRIPMAAGLAGGSTDAAATLLGLNHLWQLGLSDADLARLGAEIGSDIPFFFDTPAAWCTGRGEIVTPLELPAALHFVLLCPSFGLPTAGVYKTVVVPPTPTSGDGIQQALAKGDVDNIGRLMHNRLQTAAESFDPRIAEYAGMLEETKPAGSLMSGSGSTLFALCRTADEANRVAASLKTRTKAHDYRLIVTRTV